MSTRGAPRCVRNTPTGFPDCTSNVSSWSSRRSDSTMASKAAQLRAALPEPPYTMRSSGRSATSASRLFISMRSAASCGQPLHESAVPRGAEMVRVIVAMDKVPGLDAWKEESSARRIDTKKRERRCQMVFRKSFS